MIADGNFILVVAQKLQEFVGVQNSSLLVIDASLDEVAAEVDLGQRNVQAGIRRFGEGWAVGSTGDFGAMDGGIIELGGSEGAYSTGALLVSEEELGGDLLDFVFADDVTGYAVISLPDFSSQLIRFTTTGEADTVAWVSAPGFGGIDVSAGRVARCWRP